MLIIIEHICKKFKLIFHVLHELSHVAGIDDVDTTTKRCFKSLFIR